VVGVDFEDIRRRLEMVLQDVPEGIWSHIQDEAFLEQCVGVPPPWLAIVRQEAVAAAMTNGRLLSR
jgi:ABC-type histidine transport system ATPase subunit